MQTKHLRDKVVVITGASGGVGRVTARAFAKYKSKIALLARGVEGLEGAKKEVEDMGGRAMVVLVDVSDATAVEAAACRVEEEFGKIDIWVNNAMDSVFAPFRDIRPRNSGA
jgi:NAD(P)-dependent dehydrogenase (short-subunit alcohol dehydrogenase family)